MTVLSLLADNLAAMGPFDHVALAFAAFIVAFTVVGELKDIGLCSMAVAHAGDKLPARAEPHYTNECVLAVS